MASFRRFRYATLRFTAAKISVETLEENRRYLHATIDFDSGSNHVAATYDFADGRLNFMRAINDNAAETETFTLPENAIFFPLMRVFQGRTIFQVAKSRVTSTVIVPNIQDPGDTDNLLRPTFDERIAELIAEHDKVRVFKYLSSHYDDNSEFHLDENDLLVYYKFAQSESQIWEVTHNCAI